MEDKDLFISINTVAADGQATASAKGTVDMLCCTGMLQL